MNSTPSEQSASEILWAYDARGRACAIPVIHGQSVSRLVYTSGQFAPPPLCNGLGCCGRCIMRFTAMTPKPLPEELQLLGDKRIAAGFRLACRHTALPGMVVEINALCIENAGPPDSLALNNAPSRSELAGPGNTQEQDPDRTAAGAECTNANLRQKKLSPVHSAPGIRLAIDLGTTSVQWSALCRSGEAGSWRPYASGAMLNPQMGFGSDVMSRIAASLEPYAQKRMQQLTVNAFGKVLDTLSDMGGAAALHVEELCVAANPAMTGTLLNIDLSGLASAPYRLSYAGNSTEHVDGLDVPVYFPAMAAPFVGGDTSAGIVCLLEALPEEDFPFLYADLGTNGEFVLALSREESLSASVPMGPALEGIGLTHGRAVEKDGAGTITAFSLAPAGLVPLCPVPSTPLGISGTGYISLVHCLLRIGLLDRNGHFVRSPGTPLGTRLMRQSLEDSPGGPALNLGNGLKVYGRDIEELLKIKAAFSLAVTRLLDAAGLLASSVRGWHMAGAMGTHVNPEALESLGFLPQGASLAFHAHGNLALRGAEKMLGDKAGHYRATAARWAEKTRLVDLTANPGMLNEFTKRMRFVF